LSWYFSVALERTALFATPSKTNPAFFMVAFEAMFSIAAQILILLKLRSTNAILMIDIYLKNNFYFFIQNIYKLVCVK